MLERPNTASRIYRSTAVGDNQGGGISAMRLPGTRIRGVIVDNPSGSWVKLDGIGLGFQPYIAPYTLAWSVSLIPSVDELSAAYVTGPTGQAPLVVGAPIVVYLFEAQVPASGGSAFLSASQIDKTFSALTAGGAAGTPALGSVPTGSVLKSVALDFRNRTAGGVGSALLKIDDGAGGAAVLLAGFAKPGEPYSQVLPYSEPYVPAALSGTAAHWNVTLQINDFVGVNVYDYAATIYYR